MMRSGHLGLRSMRAIGALRTEVPRMVQLIERNNLHSLMGIKPLQQISFSGFHSQRMLFSTKPIGNNAQVTYEELEMAEEQLSDNSIYQFNLHPQLEKNLKDNGIETLFPVQVKTLEAFKESKDLFVKAKTGSGKTLGFAIPMINDILNSSANGSTRQRNQPLALIMAPTRELANQVYEEISKIAGNSLKGVVVYGGVPYKPQLEAFKRKLDFVVATPGRIIDLMQQSSVVDLTQIKFAVLDEADEMLKIGFKEELSQLFKAMPHHSLRNNFLFSATLTPQVKQMAAEYMDAGNQTIIDLVPKGEGKIPEEIEMINMIVPFSYRKRALATILAEFCSKEDGKRALVFANTKAMCEEISNSEEFTSLGIDASSLHGDMSQALRDRALVGFRTGKLRCLVATDVAARGLDIPNVDLVVHFNLPLTNLSGQESFVHRTGRTGRAGKTGKNIALHNLEELQLIRQLEKSTNRKFVQHRVPSLQVTLLKKLPATVEKLKSQVGLIHGAEDSIKSQLDANTNEILRSVFGKQLEEIDSKVMDKFKTILNASISQTVGINVDGETDETQTSAMLGRPGHVSLHFKRPEHEKKNKSLELNAAERAMKAINRGVGENALSFGSPYMTTDGKGFVVDVPAKDARRILTNSEQILQDVDLEVSEVQQLPELTTTPSMRKATGTVRSSHGSGQGRQSKSFHLKQYSRDNGNRGRNTREEAFGGYQGRNGQQERNSASTRSRRR